MGNCQAVDAAALVIQHPNGKLERIYWPVTASEVMRTNPGHYVSLIIPIPNDDDDDDDDDDDEVEERTNSDNKNKTKTVRFRRVKLLGPSDTLVLGRAYRLVTAQEVTKVLRANKREKTRRGSEVDDMQIVSNQENQNNDLIMSSDLQSEAGRSMHDNYQGKTVKDSTCTEREG